MQNIEVPKGQPNPARVEGDTVYILTNKGEIAVCCCHYALVKNFRWSCKDNGYTTTSVRRRTVYIHRLILGEPDGYVDHRDTNPRNNRCSNLRQASKQQNEINKPVQKNNTSGIKGVALNRQTEKWQAFLCGRLLGKFDTKEEAAICRAAAARREFGDFARHEYVG